MCDENSKDQARRFLEEEFVASAMAAALRTRSVPIYKKEPNVNHDRLRQWLRGQLFALGKDPPKSPAALEQKITTLAEDATKAFGPALYEGRFRIGIAQKLINLYLKYCWCAGWIHTPYHCPFDRTVKEEIGRWCRRCGCRIEVVDWPKMKTVKEYRTYVQLGKETARARGFESLAEWERLVFNRRNKS